MRCCKFCRELLLSGFRLLSVNEREEIKADPNAIDPDQLRDVLDMIDVMVERTFFFSRAHEDGVDADNAAPFTDHPDLFVTRASQDDNIERTSDEQIRMIGERRGVIGVNSILVSPREEESTLDHYVDHIEHIAELIGIDSVGIGFDFFEFIYRQWPESRQKELAAKFTTPHFIPDLTNHSHARNLTRKLIERGFSDADIEKILRGNWLRIFKELLLAGDLVELEQRSCK